MKKASKIIQWVFAGIIATFVLVNGFHYSSLFLLAGAFLMAPILRGKLGKNILIIALATVLFFTGVLTSPMEESPEGDPLNNSSVSSVLDDNSSNTSALNSGSSSDTSSNTSSDNSSAQGVGGESTPTTTASVPKYSGKAYVTINNNIPSFSSSELTTKGYEKYSSLDSLGRTQMAIASVGKETMPAAGEKRGDISNINPSGWVQAKYDVVSGGWLYNRCHLIGWQLSAENANKKNLITGTKYLNVSGMLPFENMVADYIKETGNHVAYRITPIYEGKNLLASGIQMEAYSVEDNGEGICFNVYCYNVQPQITINYATGTSKSNSSSSNNSSSSSSSSSSNSAVTSKPSSSSISSSSSSSTSSVTSKPSSTGSKVWIPESGKKYHSISSCSGMKNPSQVSKSKAESMGYTPCKKCY